MENQPLRITLDTNCIINALDNESKTATSIKELEQILDLGKKGKLDLAVTTRFQADQANDKDKKRVIRIANELSKLPIATVGGPFRLGISCLDSEDMLL